MVNSELSGYNQSLINMQSDVISAYLQTNILTTPTATMQTHK